MDSQARGQLEAYLDTLRYQQRLSPRTLEAYGRDLRRLETFCDTRRIARWEGVHLADLRGHIAERHRQHIGGRSLHRELSAIRGLFNFLLKQGAVAANPASGVRAPKAPRTLPRPLDVDQMAGLLDAPSENLLELRDLAMWELFYSSGLRLTELTRLDRIDLDLAAGAVLVRQGKGRKTRHVPVGACASQALQAWLTVREQWPGTETPAVFLSCRGARIAPRTVQARLERWQRKLGLAERIHPQRLRHSFASHLLESSGDLRAVQELLGHANLSTTQVYTHLDFQHLATVYDRTHPRARKDAAGEPE